jgi:hypothetical protein
MSLTGRTRVLAAALLGAGLLLPTPLLAQTATNPPVAPRPNPAVVSPAASAPATPVEMPPLLLIGKSPIAFFRELLAMDGDEQNEALRKYTPERQAQIVAKLEEYQSLDPDARELRLRVTELCWYLRPLMATPATERAAQLARVPEPNRSLLEKRLAEWDKVPADIQKELLGLEPTLRYFTEIGRFTPLQRQQMLNNMSPGERKRLEKGLQRWYAMSEPQHQLTLRRFNQFFELNGTEKEKALKTLSEPERRQMEKTLRTFGNLPEDQRAQCLQSFEKFASLSLAERQEFLKNAERWKQMSPSEREAWRQLVNYVPPPLPPPPPPPLPPIPDAAAMATNRP